MDISSIMLNIVGCALLEIIAGVLLPDGRMKKFTLSIISVFLFYSLVYPLTSFLLGGGLDNIFYEIF